MAKVQGKKAAATAKKPAVKAASPKSATKKKVAAKPAAKAAPKPKAKAKPAAKPKAAAKSTAKKVVKPAVKVAKAAKPKPVAKAKAVKAAKKPAVKAAKAAKKPAKAAAKPAKAAAKKASKPAPKAATKPAVKPAPKAAAKPSPKSAAKPATKPAGKTAAAPAAKVAVKTAPKAASGKVAPSAAGKAPAAKTVAAPKAAAPKPAAALRPAKADDKKRVRRPRTRVSSSGTAVATWFTQGDRPRPSSFIPAPPRAEAPSLIAAPPASSDRLVSHDELTEFVVRTVPVRVDIEQGAGRIYLNVNPQEVLLRSGEGIEWDFRYLGGADIVVDDLVLDFEKPAPFAVATFRSRRPGTNRPHRQLSGPIVATAIGSRRNYTIRALNMYKTELAVARLSINIV